MSERRVATTQDITPSRSNCSGCTSHYDVTFLGCCFDKFLRDIYQQHI